LFTIEMLPAQRGDCLWISYGEGRDQHHILIDGGPQDTIPTVVNQLERRIAALPGATDRVELLVITHVDADHIQGIVSLLSDHRRVRLFRDVWFNGFKHLEPGLLGGPDGERLTRALETESKRWNAAFGGGPVSVSDRGPVPIRRLQDGLEVTLLGPFPAALKRLAPQWEKTCRKAGILPGFGAEISKSLRRNDQLLGFDIDALAAAPAGRDRSAPNATSISMIASYRGQRVLLLGDAVPTDVIAALDRLGASPHDFTAVKMSHHGSRNNTNLELLKRIRAKYWLVSTNGAAFGHPDVQALAQVVTTQQHPVFVLNYVTPHVSDLIGGAGNRYSVRLPHSRRDGTYTEGIVQTISE
jgi:hypothetical protein